MEQNRKLSVQEVVEELHARGFTLTARAVRADIRAGRLRAHKFRETYYIDKEDLDAYIKAGETKPEQVAC